MAYFDTLQRVENVKMEEWKQWRQNQRKRNLKSPLSLVTVEVKFEILFVLRQTEFDDYLKNSTMANIFVIFYRSTIQNTTEKISRHTPVYTFKC